MKNPLSASASFLEERMGIETPKLTVDALIYSEGQIVLIRRKNPPYQDCWALPGGFVDVGETVEEACVREMKEETSLDVELVRQLGAYSAPDRDPRHHAISVVFLARAKGEPEAKDDAQGVGVFTEKNLPSPLAFDHEKIVAAYFAWKETNKT